MINTVESISDADLVSHSLSGDREAFGHIIDSRSGMIRMLSRIVVLALASKYRQVQQVSHRTY